MFTCNKTPAHKNLSAQCNIDEGCCHQVASTCNAATTSLADKLHFRRYSIMCDFHRQNQLLDICLKQRCTVQGLSQYSAPRVACLCAVDPVHAEQPLHGRKSHMLSLLSPCTAELNLTARVECDDNLSAFSGSYIGNKMMAQVIGNKMMAQVIRCTAQKATKLL